jgi:hypothetical protein
VLRAAGVRRGVQLPALAGAQAALLQLGQHQPRGVVAVAAVAPVKAGLRAQPVQRVPGKLVARGVFVKV